MATRSLYCLSFSALSRQIRTAGAKTKASDSLSETEGFHQERDRTSPGTSALSLLKPDGVVNRFSSAQTQD